MPVLGVLPFFTIQRQRCIRILCPKDPDFYTLLARCIVKRAAPSSTGGVQRSVPVLDLVSQLQNRKGQSTKRSEIRGLSSASDSEILVGAECLLASEGSVWDH